jgi:hypothetical protein
MRKPVNFSSGMPVMNKVSASGGDAVRPVTGQRLRVPKRKKSSGKDDPSRIPGSRIRRSPDSVRTNAPDALPRPSDVSGRLKRIQRQNRVLGKKLTDWQSRREEESAEAAHAEEQRAEWQALPWVERIRQYLTQWWSGQRLTKRGAA